MSFFRISRRAQLLTHFAPISERPGIDRRMRVAVQRAKRGKHAAKHFSVQQSFDKAVAELVQATPVSQEVSEWFRNEKLIPTAKRSWRKIARNPAVISAALAVAVIVGIAVFIVMERMKEFPGSGTARKMLTIASSTKSGQLDPVNADAGSLGDFFFMKYQLEHYDVAPEFAHLRASACKVFDDDEGHRVAQISVPEKRMQFFLFPAERSPKDMKPRLFNGWRFVEQEGWTGAVQVKNGVCFMAALRGDAKDLAPYLAKQIREPSGGG
ncbi:MAG: hypothetical protein M3128_01595 [Verrucomicrobiota bacterium]|nr:hypothetical protein [Verrucomicrobiota bacterium]